MEAFVPLSRISRPDAAWWVRQREIVPEPPERVWRAITEPSELAQWWCERAEVDARPGGWFAFHGRYAYGDDPSLPRSAFEVLEVEEPARIEFRWPLLGVETRVSIEVSGLMEESEVVAVQTAAARPAWAPPEGAHQWWSVALPALRSYLESGRADLRVDYRALRSASEIRFQVPVSTFPWMVWRKLTDAAELRRWLSSEVAIDPRPGGVLELGSGPGPKRILELEPEKLLVFDWHEAGRPPGRVRISIEEGEEATVLTLAEEDLPPGEAEAARDRRIFRWAGAILHLKQLAERGTTPREYQEG